MEDKKMEKLVFNKNSNGEINTTIINETVRNNRGNSLKINKAALEEAAKKSKCKKTSYGNRNVFNDWYTFDDMIILRVSYMNRDEESYFVFDNAANGNYIPVLFENKNVIYTRKKDKRETSRKTPLVGIKNVKYKNKKGEIIIQPDKTKAVNVGTVLWLLAYGVLDDIKGTKICNVVNQEIHHKSYDFDNRLKNIELVSSERHKEIHQSTTYKSHQMMVEINDFEELIAFINFIRKH